jgi:hypothetical protein
MGVVGFFFPDVMGIETKSNQASPASSLGDA